MASVNEAIQNLKTVAANEATRVLQIAKNLRARTEDEAINISANALESVAKSLTSAAEITVNDAPAPVQSNDALQAKTGRTSSAAPNQANAPKAKTDAPPSDQPVPKQN